MSKDRESKKTVLHGKRVNIMSVVNEEVKNEKTESNETDQREGIAEQRINRFIQEEDCKSVQYRDLVNRENQEQEQEDTNLRFHHLMVVMKPPSSFHQSDRSEEGNDAELGKVQRNIEQKDELQDEITPGPGDNKKEKVPCCSCLLTSQQQLPPSPSLVERGRYALLCPPHGCLGTLLTYSLVVCTVWGVAYCILGQVALPGTESIHVTVQGGTVFALLVMLVVAYSAGWLMQQVKMPPLLGMLLTGIVLKNVPLIDVAHGVDPDWYAATRSIALVVILLRACLGLNPAILKQLSAMVFRLAFLPCLAEATAVAIASYLLLGLPWIWGFMLGFILAAVSPAVVVSCLLSLQDRGFGVTKGIPTLVIAAASMDDVLAISCFTILLGITFNTEPNLVLLLLHGPLEVVVAVVWGLGWGILITFLPGQPNPSPLLRLILLGGGALLALFGSDLIHLKGAGALAILVMAFTAGVGWRRQGWGDSNPVTESLAALWTVFQPLLFSLIGAEIQLAALSLHTVAWGLLVVLCGISARMLVAFLAVGGGENNHQERLFVALAWMPKATVQAAMGPLALGKAQDALENYLKVHPGQDCVNVGQDEGELETFCSMVEYGKQLLTIAVMVILLTAPLGAIAIMVTGPRLLSRDTEEENDKKREDP